MNYTREENDIFINGICYKVMAFKLFTLLIIADLSVMMTIFPYRQHRIGIHIK